MSDKVDPFANQDINQAIELRWTLRDIRGKRLIMTPIDPGQLTTLMEMGLVEMRGDEPALTNAGLDLII